MSIGVYGHPSSELSRYTLLVYQVTDATGIYLTDQNSPDDNFQGSRQSNKVYLNKNFNHLIVCLPLCFDFSERKIIFCAVFVVVID